MRLVNIDLDKPLKDCHLGREVLGTVSTDMRKTYQDPSSSQWYRRVGEDMLGIILPILDYDVKGKAILDLGCGSKDSFDCVDRTRRTYEPWLCRSLHELGANVTGVDLHASEGEEFRYLESDLTRKNSLKQIESHSIDLACAFSLLDSPELLTFFGMEAGNQILENIVPQLERILKQNGIFVFNPTGTKYHIEKEYYFIKQLAGQPL